LERKENFAITKDKGQFQHFYVLGAVMKKTALMSLMVSLVLISLVFEVQPDVKALNFFTDLNIWSTSPLNSTTYYSSKLTLNVTLSAFETDNSINVDRKAWYSLDGQERLPLPLVNEGITSKNGNALPLSIVLGVIGLPPLSDGIHNVTVYGEFDFPTKTIRNSYTIIFAIDTTPIILSNLVENKTYNTSDIPLRFNVDGKYSWLGYGLDNFANVTIDGNTTLTGLSDGYHSLVIYANDTSGNIGASKTIRFNVEVPEPFPTILVAAFGASLAIIAVCLLVYFKKRKH
jgi:hypothetical protein